MPGIITTISGDASQFTKVMAGLPGVAANAGRGMTVALEKELTQQQNLLRSHLATMRSIEEELAKGPTGDRLNNLTGSKVRMTERIENLKNDIEARKSFVRLQHQKANDKAAADQSVALETEALGKRNVVASRAYADRVRMSAGARKIAAADAKLEAATLALHEGFAPGIKTSKSDLKPLRDAVAQATRERRAIMRGSGARGGGGHEVGSVGGVARESMVLVREAIRGDISRMASSALLLSQYLSSMDLPRKLIDALSRPIGAAGAAAGTGFLAGFLRTVSAIPLLAVGLAAAAVAGIIGSFFIYANRVKNLAASLIGGTMGNLGADRSEKTSAHTEGLNKMSDALRKVADDYNSAAAASQRFQDLLGDQHDAERQLLAIQKEAALRRGGDPGKIEKEFRKKELDLTKKQEREKMMEMTAAQLAAKNEAIAKTTQADALHLPTAAAFDQRLKDSAKNAADAKTKLNTLDENGTRKKDGLWVDLENASKAAAGYDDPRNADRQIGAETARARLAAAKAAVALQAGFINSDAILRAGAPEMRRRIARRDELSGQGAAAAGLSDTIAGNITTESARFKARIKQLQEIIDAKDALPVPQQGPNHLNALQKIGAFTAGGNTQLLDVTKEMNRGIRELVAQGRAGIKPGAGAVKF